MEWFNWPTLVIGLLVFFIAVALSGLLWKFWTSGRQAPQEQPKKPQG